MRTVLVALVFLLGVLVGSSVAKISDHVVVGKTYAVIWAYYADGTGSREVIHIHKVDKDGWVLASNLDAPNTLWWINLNQALSFKELTAPPVSSPHPPPLPAPTDEYRVRV